MASKDYFSNLSDQYQREVAERTKKYDVLKKSLKKLLKYYLSVLIHT